MGVREIEEGSPIVVEGCVDSNHGDHMYLAPFHLTNPELMSVYEHIMNGDNDDEKESIEHDYETLK